MLIRTDAIMAYETVHYNNAVPFETSKFRSLVVAFQKAEFSVLFSLNVLNAMQNSIFIVGTILITVLSAYQISQGYHKISDFVTLLTYFAQLQAPLAFFGSFYNQAQNSLVDAERMLELVSSHWHRKLERLADIRHLVRGKARGYRQPKCNAHVLL
jgi:ATP-binding cassette, subfamily B, vacuolar membrane transporter HMT1/ACLQ